LVMFLASEQISKEVWPIQSAATGCASSADKFWWCNW
jgi:hypothetical protein